MENQLKRQFFTKHAKSSALVFSLVIHSILIVVAVSYVVVTVIHKDDQQFDVVKVAHPRMQLRKLQVPVELKERQANKPRLRKHIVVQPRLNQDMPDIRMSEITGVKDNMGSADAGLGGGGGRLGFSLPEINVFGLKSRGEKVFLILDCGPDMMVDERGGIPAYDIIKNELLSIIDNLPSTSLFNLSVYSKGDTYVLFPQMKSATQPNVEKARAWLGPLNQFTPGMGSEKHGPRTLGPGGTSTQVNLALPPLRNSSWWLRSGLIAMQQQADAIYVLTESWGSLNYVMDTFDKENGKGSESDQRRWEAAVAKAKRMFDEENRQRREKGIPPKVMGSKSLVEHYLPGVKRPRSGGGGGKKHDYTPAEIEKGMKAVREKYGTGTGRQVHSGVIRNKDKFSFNVVHFTTRADNAPIDQFKVLTSNLDGNYKRLKGLDAIRFNATYPPEITGDTNMRSQASE